MCICIVNERRAGREFAALRERLAALSAALLRICASLDVDTVLREIAAPGTLRAEEVGDAAGRAVVRRTGEATGSRCRFARYAARCCM